MILTIGFIALLGVGIYLAKKDGVPMSIDICHQVPEGDKNNPII